VGLWLCQILKAKGAHVIATAGTEEKRQLALKNGAEVCVGYEEEELLKVVNEKTNGQGVHAVFDGVGKSTWATSLKAVRRKGMLASFGNASGAVPPVTLATLTGKNVKICRPTLFNYLITKEEWEYYTSKLWKLIGEEKMDVHIHKTYDMKDVQQAHLVRFP
jgi:NADPH2:quinone reductase